jgi:para-aminobenzoate synthetase component 1
VIVLERGPEGVPALFAQPQARIVAWQPEQVGQALDDMAAAQAAGRWLAGYASYELGYALEPRLQHLMPERSVRRVPLLAFEVHAAPVSAAPLLAQWDAAPPAHITPWVSDWSAQRYRIAFDTLRQWIAQGDCYQANLTFALRAQTNAPAQSLYAQLRRQQAVPFGAFLDMGVGPVVLSRSPELFFRLDARGTIEACPMKGTMPRHTDATQDAAIVQALQRSAKNRAENIMIVDLLRNDIGRLCEVGSVHVPELFKVQTYATVHQMVSRVVGQLRPGVGLPALFNALFPCGSVTGAPKIRAMEIIRALESEPRGVYCGSIGWIAPDGAAEMSVAIRTLSLFEGGEVVLNVGSGVVFDSTADHEYEEALWKARFAQSASTRPV